MNKPWLWLSNSNRSKRVPTIQQSPSLTPHRVPNQRKRTKIPPFANSPSKLGNTKQFNGKTYYWCPVNHKHSHCHTKNVEECKTNKLKWFCYDVIQVNNYISSAVRTIKAAASAGGMITDQEILYFQFKVYKKIKFLTEWTTHILLLESTVASTPGYTRETLFNETQAKYITLLNQGLWKPSNKTPEEQTLAMVAQQQQVKKGSNNPTKSKPNSSEGAKPTEKEKRTLHLLRHPANKAIPNSGMARHTTGVLPTQTLPLAHAQGG